MGAAVVGGDDPARGVREQDVDVAARHALERPGRQVGDVEERLEAVVIGAGGTEPGWVRGHEGRGRVGHRSTIVAARMERPRRRGRRGRSG